MKFGLKGEAQREVMKKVNGRKKEKRETRWVRTEKTEGYAESESAESKSGPEVTGRKKRTRNGC